MIADNDHPSRSEVMDAQEVAEQIWQADDDELTMSEWTEKIAAIVEVALTNARSAVLSEAIEKVKARLENIAAHRVLSGDKSGISEIIFDRLAVQLKELIAELETMLTTQGEVGK